MKTTIIFGSNGLLGKEVVKTLMERGDKVIGVDISEDNKKCSKFFKKDLLKFESIIDIVSFLEELNIVRLYSLSNFLTKKLPMNPAPPVISIF